MHTYVTLAAMALLCAIPPAHAGMIFSLERTGASVDFPLLRAYNESTESIAGLRLTIGDPSMNFDSATLVDASAGLIPLLLSPDDVNGEVRSDVLAWAFAGFVPGTEFSSRLDIDRNQGSATVDWQFALFNNGDDVPNAVLTVLWENGTATSVTLHDEPGRDPLSAYVVHVPVLPVPEPGSVVLLLLGACCIAARFMLRFASRL